MAAPPAARPAAPAPPRSASSSESSVEDVEEEEPPNAGAMVPAQRATTTTAPEPAAPAVPWFQNKADEMACKASSFSRALTRAQQALKTAARISREAAMDFEAELENFALAQKDIDREFGGGGGRSDLP